MRLLQPHPRRRRFAAGQMQLSVDLQQPPFAMRIGHSTSQAQPLFQGVLRGSEITLPQRHQRLHPQRAGQVEPVHPRARA